MILIADSGSTKTDWCLMHHGEVVTHVTTQGLNPFYQDDATISGVIETELMARWPSGLPRPHKVFFYGAGVRPEMSSRMFALLRAATGAEYVEAHGDLLGAARALFGREAGIACILGTGSNSGLYDGSVIVQNTPPLGFILGDEGSGAVLGKRFVADLCKGLLPEALREEYFATTGQDVASIIRAVYREPLPNRHLAQATRFIHSHLHLESVEALVVNSFRDFFRRNLVQYGRSDLPVRAVGSVAHYFGEQLCRAAAEEGFAVSGVMQSPIEGLVIYHQGE
ncbi:MAG: ATPase [Prevotella sp.]|nr:ATPase [Prevotella sp.]